MGFMSGPHQVITLATVLQALVLVDRLEADTFSVISLELILNLEEETLFQEANSELPVSYEKCEIVFEVRGFGKFIFIKNLRL